MTALEVKGLSFGYRDSETKALDGVSFSIDVGEYLCVIGRNGSGKSTLIRTIAGINTQFDGEISIFGTVLSKETLPDLRRKMGLVFQNPDNQFVGSTVRDDIAFGLENRAVPSEEMDVIIERYASKVGMLDYLDRAPETLSGGQKQRVAIAGILAMSPSLVMYDEATSMLDPLGKRGILELTASLRKENPSLTVISVTHDIDEAYKADKVLVLKDGKVLLFGTPAEVFSSPAFPSSGLSLPLDLRLINALRDKGVSVPKDVGDFKELEEFLCQ